MKLFPARTLCLARTLAIAVVVVPAALSGKTQNPTNVNPGDAQSSQGQTAPGQAVAPAPAQKPAGKVIFQRSIDANGNTVSNTGAAAKPGPGNVEVPTVEDADREAVTVTGLDLDVRLNTAAQQIAVRGQVTVRNSGKTPIKRIPLQISSSLNWERVRIAGQDVRFPVGTVDSDSDHTLQLHEAAVQLPEPLAAGASVQLEVLYSGKIETQAARLVSLGIAGRFSRAFGLGSD